MTLSNTGFLVPNPKEAKFGRNGNFESVLLFLLVMATNPLMNVFEKAQQVDAQHSTLNAASGDQFNGKCVLVSCINI